MVAPRCAARQVQTEGAGLRRERSERTLRQPRPGRGAAGGGARYWTTFMPLGGVGGGASGLVFSSSFQAIMRALAASASASGIMFLRM